MKPDAPKRPYRTILCNALFWWCVLLYLELVLHGAAYHAVTLRVFYLIGFSAVIALVLAALGLMPTRGNKIAATTLVCLLCVLFASQLIYFYIFGSLYSLSMITLGGNAVLSFWKETLLAIVRHLPVLLLVFLPIPATCLVRKFLGEQVFGGPVRVERVTLVCAAIVLQTAMLLSLHIGGTGFFTAYSLYHDSSTTTTQAVDSFGLLTTFRLEFRQLFRTQEPAPDYYVEPEPEPSPTPSQAPEYGWNVLDIDFDALAAQTEDERLKAISNYCASLKGTRQNEYTGMLSDYNLIVLCGEAFSAAAVDPVYTPTLYRMAHEGIVFNNYYNTFPNVTTDGEYSLCLGLLPDKTRGKTASSMYASRNSYLPLSLGNLFLEQRGIQAYGYHNYTKNFYGRELTHPNLGYQMKFAGDGMSFTTSWPASDLEMMQQSIPDYIGQEQFHAYYMTFSGHMQYYRSGNPMAERNYAAVKDLNVSEAAKCYLSCNIELDKAMEYLLSELERAGVADRTAIVMAGDHFPYGLTNAQYDELIGHETDYFERYHDTLIFWVGGLEEPIIVDDYCCNVDILPTILNLWGFDYDSRLLAGTDVFSDSAHIAMLVDQSFLTDRVWFNVNTNTATWLAGEDDADAAYLETLIKLVKNRFSISTDILNTAYYNFVFGKDRVTVTHDGWISEDEWNGVKKDEREDPPEGEGDGETGVPPEGETGQPAAPPEDATGQALDSPPEGAGEADQPPAAPAAEA